MPKSKHFTVRNMRNSLDWTKLRDDLLRDGTPAVSTNLVPVDELFSSLFLHGCRTVVLEDPYMDEDHRLCHARLHYLAQMTVSRYCRRLHFFSPRFRSSDLRELPESAQNGYMGMSVWRPMNSFPLGRTIVSPDNTIITPISKNWKPYLTCSGEFPVHLAGNDLTIAGGPFIQQDHMVAACATAAVWMAQYYMASRSDEFIAHYSPEITEAATQYDLSLGRAIPSEGLHNGQILQAFRGLGYDPISYDVINTSSTVARRLLYRLIESRIPVVVGLLEPDENFEVVGHAITALGHGLDDSISPSLRYFPERGRSRSRIRYIDSSDFSVAFLVNDDAAGLYRWMELMDINDIDDNLLTSIFGSRANTNRARRFIRRLKDRAITVVGVFYNSRGNPDMVAGLDFLAAPLPRAITLPPREAQDKALTAFKVVLGDAVIARLPELVVRTYLVESNKYKNYLGNVLNPASDFRWWMRSFYLPKWIWVTEFSTRQTPDIVTGRRVIASVISDSSAPRDTLDFLLMQIGGWVIPVEEKRSNVVHLIQDIARGRAPIQLDNGFSSYVQFED
jgi:hypothetical protein